MRTEPSAPGIYLGYPVPWGYKYEDLALQDGGISYETVKYGPRVTALAKTSSNYASKLQTNPLVREGAAHQETRNFWE
jgi:hypothetical protein